MMVNWKHYAAFGVFLVLPTLYYCDEVHFEVGPTEPPPPLVGTASAANVSTANVSAVTVSWSYGPKKS
jgi:hypothetical protein